MSIGVLLRGFIGDMMNFGDVILRTLFPSFMAIQACSTNRLLRGARYVCVCVCVCVCVYKKDLANESRAEI